MADDMGRRILDGEMPEDEEQETARRILDGDYPQGAAGAAKVKKPLDEAARRILDGEAPDDDDEDEDEDEDDDGLDAAEREAIAQQILDGEIRSEDPTINSNLAQRILSTKNQVSEEERSIAQRILDGDMPSDDE
eukprot:m.229001 g.229001  ORF g.229001 m.229001 type:complete len:135 (-) comp17647_c0_seq1:176-580(-)